MAALLVAASAAFAVSGSNTRALKLVFTAGDTNPGTAVIKTGGTGGTATTIIFQTPANSTQEVDLTPYNVIGDYLTLSNATAMISFLRDQGKL